MIDQDTVQRIIETAKVEDIISDFITLKKRGVNYIGNCPFHNEKTPSFTVSPAKGIYKCFGCGKGGNSISFVMDHEQISYLEALKWVAAKYKIEIHEKELSSEDIKKKNNRESMLVVSTYAQKYFSQILNNHQEGKAVGLSYFKERGFRDDIIEKFQLGYSLSEKDAFTNEAVKNGYKIEYLEQTGLTIVNENYQNDRFRGRVMFPIQTLSGQVIGFGGRVLKIDPEKKIAKYLNSPQSEIYDKSKTLYGIYFAKRSIVQENKCFLVEGYTDVISMHQSGIENVVAASGTSLTDQQIQLINRFTPNITIIFDGDPAGIRASLRGINMVLEAGMNVKILLLPDGDDPDSFAKKHNSTELKEYITEHEQDFITFKTHLLLGETEGDPIKKANLITDIINTIAVIPDTITQSVYIKECSKILEVAEDILVDAIKKKGLQKLHGKDSKYINPRQEYKAQPQVQQQNQHQHQPQQTAAVTIDNFCLAQEKEIIRLLLVYGTTQFSVDGNDQIKSIKDYFHFELTLGSWNIIHPFLKQVFDEYYENIDAKGDNIIKHFVNHPDSKISSYTADILSEKYTLSKIWTRKESLVVTEDLTLNELVPQTTFTYKKRRIDMKINELSLLLKDIVDVNESMEILSKIKNLKNFQIAISKDINSSL